jgi:hypothetical protein
MNIGGARELSKLIKELDLLTDRDILNQPLFAAHSEADTTAAIDEIEELVDRSYARHQRAEMFRIGKNFAIPHASIGLKNPVVSSNKSPLEPSNPFFDQMMESLIQIPDFSEKPLDLLHTKDRSRISTKAIFHPLLKPYMDRSHRSLLLTQFQQ